MPNVKDDLVKVSTYAKNINKSTTWVYRLIETGKLIAVEIDGVKFIKKLQ